MIAELLLFVLLWAALGAAIGFIFGIPLFLSVPIGLLLLVLYSFLVPSRPASENPQQPITVRNFLPFLRDLGFFLLVFVLDAALLLFTMYIESGGAKLAFPNFRWPKEVIAIFELLGIPNLSPPLVYGVATTLLFALANYLIMRNILQLVGVLQSALQRRATERSSSGIMDFRQELSQLIQPLCIMLVIAFLTYRYLFPWMANVAKLQLAKMFWPADFSVTPTGEAISSISANPDLSLLMERHRSEFYCYLLLAFPAMLLGAHLLAAFLSEVFFLHTNLHLGQFEQRHNEVVNLIRSRISEAFTSASASLSHLFGNIRRRLQEISRPAPQPPAETDQASQPSTASPPQTPATAPSQTPATFPSPDTRQPPSGEEAQEGTEEETPLPPEDQPVKVIGDGEYISPREARKHPELYVVVEERNKENPSDVSYEIYTVEFFQRRRQEEANTRNNGRR